MGQIKAVFRDVKTEHLEKLFGGAVIAVHEIEGTTVVETHGHGYVLTETEAALLRALTDLDVQRTSDLASVISKYEDTLRTRKEYINELQELAKALRAEKEGFEKKLELEVSANEAQRAAINEMRAELKEAQRALGLARQAIVERVKARQKLVAKKPRKKV